MGTMLLNKNSMGILCRIFQFAQYSCGCLDNLPLDKNQASCLVAANLK